VKPGNIPCASQFAKPGKGTGEFCLALWGAAISEMAHEGDNPTAQDLSRKDSGTGPGDTKFAEVSLAYGSTRCRTFNEPELACDISNNSQTLDNSPSA